MSDKTRVLLVAANPDPGTYGHLDLNREFRDIQQVFQSANQRDRFELLFPREAATTRDLRAALLQDEPHIVHISGHGTGPDGLVLDDGSGSAKLVRAAALARLFSLFKDQVKCLVLNACYSAEQAEFICQHIDFVIGMDAPIGDRSAREFARDFYEAVFNGRDYEFAHQYGRDCILSEVGRKDVNVPIPYRRLRATTTPQLGVYTWAAPPANEAFTVLLNWTPHYNQQTRNIASQTVWHELLLPELRQVKTQLQKMPGLECIEVKAKASLTVMLALGYTFPEVGAYQLQVEQSSGNQTVHWRSHEPPSDAAFQVVEEKTTPDAELIIAFGITGDARPDIEKFVEDSARSFSLVYCEPIGGTGPTAIASNADATALAADARAKLSQYTKQYRAQRSHLILYAPQGFALFLGQKLNALGEIVAYERKGNGGYQVGVVLQTH